MKKVFQRIFFIKISTRFVSNLANKVTSDYTLSGMKSHDYHVLLQFIIFIVIRDLFSRKVKEGFDRLARFLRWICKKNIVTEKILFWKVDFAKVMCLFETCMQPHFSILYLTCWCIFPKRWSKHIQCIANGCIFLRGIWKL
jgi:hypothetical protein